MLTSAQRKLLEGRETSFHFHPPSLFIYFPIQRRKQASLPLLLLPPAGWGGKEEMLEINSICLPFLSLLFTRTSHFFRSCITLASYETESMKATIASLVLENVMVM